MSEANSAQISGRTAHPRVSSSLIGSAVVFVHHLEFLRQAEEALGVTDKQVAAGIQAMPELVDQALLLGFVEINHDVAAENDVVAAGQEFGLQIVKIELHQFFQLAI